MTKTTKGEKQRVDTELGLRAALRESISKPTVYSAGDGLYLRRRPDGANSWFFASAKGGTRREMGLGAYPRVKLADARAEARRSNTALHEGRDPFAERALAKVAKDEEPAAVIGVPTFGDFSDTYVSEHAPSFKNAKHRQQWENTLKTLAASLRAIPIDQVGTDDVLAVLKPIWTTTNETASRLRGRIERILDAAAVAGHRDPDRKNPATWNGHLQMVLPRRKKKREKKHHPAMPWADVPAFMAALRGHADISARALEFTVLTAARTGEVIGARLAEFDLEKELWTIPAERMKAGISHIVPLSPRALMIVEEMRVGSRPTDFLFRGRKGGLSQMAMLEKLRGLRPGLTVHGFRSSFRDYAADGTDHPSEIAEFALAHIIGDSAKAAYFRTTMIEKRRGLMVDWADYVSTAEDEPTARSNATPATSGRPARVLPGQVSLFE